MGRIVSKLNLNRTPQLVENNSLIFAKNIRVLADGSIGPDKAIDNIDLTHFLAPVYDTYGIKGIIESNNELYLFVEGKKNNVVIDSIWKLFKPGTSYIIVRCPCNWTWNGGIIDGNVITNLNGDTILNVIEYNSTDGDTPLKSINLNTSSINDDESIYSQAQNISFNYLKLVGNYITTIPSGTYQFFIRYELKPGYFTKWFPASKKLYAGYIKNLKTNLGGLSYNDLTEDAATSFVFNLKSNLSVNNYIAFQLGFLLKHDDVLYARKWKSFSATDFNIDTDKIYFDYNSENIEEISVTDLLDSVFELYNVKNITSFKNKLYVSNYVESDLNVLDNSDYNILNNYAQSIDISIKTKETRLSYSYLYNNVIYPVTINNNVNNNSYIWSLNNISIGALLNPSATPPGFLDDDELKAYLIDNTSTDKFTKTYNYGVTISCTKTITTSTAAGSNKYWLVINGGAEPPVDNVNTLLSDVLPYVDCIDVVTGKFVHGYYSGGTFFARNDNIKINYSKAISGGSDLITTTLSITINSDNIKTDGINKQQTLLPYCKYNFYAHFITATGEVTNGFFIKSIELNDETIQNFYTYVNGVYAFYPKFEFAHINSNKYIGCFISISHVKYKIAQVFNIEEIDDNFIGDCIELDTQLLKANNNISIYSEDNIFSGKYYASYDTDNLTTFGSTGKVYIQESSVDSNKTNIIKIPYESIGKDELLFQLTPYIKIDGTGSNIIIDDYDILDLPHYICSVKKLKSNLDVYVSGNKIYGKTITDNNVVLDDTVKWSDNPYSDTPYNKIYSLYNLNYLSLTLDVQEQIITEDDVTSVILPINSIILSDIYELKSMYIGYIGKTYIQRQENTIRNFENTIRSSELVGDESKQYIFNFRATDYYNVPTTKGIIVNLVSVGNAILVHTRDTLFKFSGYNSLSSNGGEEIALQESNIFDTGIQEVFGSEFGFAGLQSKENQFVSEYGYVFYDSDSNKIYLYRGEGQLTCISDNIEKLLNIENQSVNKIVFANDYYNDRFFIHIIYNASKKITLSYNIRVNSFISLHDFKFSKSYNNKNSCYFIDEEYSEFIYYVKDKCVETEDSELIYSDLTYDDIVYPSYPNNLDNGNKHAIVDVLVNLNYETIKNVNSVSWVCNAISAFARTLGDTKSLLVAEEAMNKFPGNYIRIYTDSCSTDLIPLIEESNVYALHSPASETPNVPPTVNYKEASRGATYNPSLLPINTLNSYKYPRYNLGKWSLNYFRNILNQTIEDAQQGNPNKYSNSDSDNQSLIYGKYIVVRFVFDRSHNFKLEDVSLNLSNNPNI